jgi:hypothetical protein
MQLSSTCPKPRLSHGLLGKYEAASCSLSCAPRRPNCTQADSALLVAQIDWDYHMRLVTMGQPGQALSEQRSIIHFYHFRHWRLHGVAYELRDSLYDQPNFTMVTTALGRTKEFKDR